MYDNSLHFAQLSEEKSNILKDYNLVSNKFILTTIHRDHNTDIQENLCSIFKALLKISEEYKIVLPLHPRTKNKLNGIDDRDLYDSIFNNENLLIIPPTSFLDMLALEKSSKMVITDSGGVQKEAYFFNKPCVILRPETEWVEILETGKAKLTSANYNDIMIAYNRFNEDKLEKFPQIFGCGEASQFICNVIFTNQKEL